MSWFSRIAATFRQDKKDDDLEEELRSHREMRAQDNVSAGMGEQEADLDARRRFGNSALIQERTRAEHLVVWLETVVQDIRYGLRTLRRSPAFTIVAVLTVALAVGATTAVFTVVNSVLLRPLPYEHSDRLMTIATFMPRDNSEVTGSPTYTAWRSNSRSLEDAAAWFAEDFNFSGIGDPDRIPGAVTTASFFTTLGVHAQLGRVFSTDEDRPGHERVVVISHSLWQGRFNGNKDLLGKSILLDGTPHVVLGVLPHDFRFPDADLQPDLFVPIAMPPSQDGVLQGMLIVQVVGRVKPGISMEQAHADVQNVFQQLLATYPQQTQNFFAGSSVHLRSLQTELVGPVRRALLVLMAAVGFVLLIGCLNIASLQLARAVQRSQEVGVRSALGAGRTRLLRQLITENLVLSGCGAIGGLFLAILAATAVRTAKLRALPAVSEVHIDWWVLGFVAIITVLSGIFFGIAPAFWVSRSGPAESMGKGAKATTGAGHRRLRNLMVMAELAVAVVLLAGAGLMVHSFRRLTRVDPGFDLQGVLTARISLPETSYPQQEQKFAFVQQVMDELRATPGVESVSLTTTLPLMPYDLSSSIYIEGRPKPPPGMAPMVPVIRTSPGYFHTLKIPLVAGRAFNDADTASAPMVAIVNQSFARSFFPGEDALGKKFRIPLPDASPVIVGIVADVHHLGLEKSASPEIYYPLRQSKIQDDGVAFVTRARDLPGTATVLRNIVKKIDPNQPVFDIVSMERQLAGSLAARKLNMILLAGFALLALALAAVGIYGVLSYSVAQRRHEIGIRMALGSDRGRVMKLVLREAVFLSLAGVVIGIVGALVLTRFMASLLYNTRASDPLTMFSVSALLIVVGMIAGYVPAHRASKVDPMIALRAE